MSIEPREAEFLCTGSEFQLFRDSCEPLIRQYSPGAIRRCMERALKLAAMWQSKAQADRAAARERHGRQRLHSITGHVLARRKAVLFDEVAQRFGDRLYVLGEIARLGHGISYEEETVEGTGVARV